MDNTFEAIIQNRMNIAQAIGRSFVTKDDGIPVYPEAEFQKALDEGAIEIFTVENVSEYTRKIQKAEHDSAGNPALATEIEKAKKDLAKLVKVKKQDSRGRMVTYYVRATAGNVDQKQFTIGGTAVQTKQGKKVPGNINHPALGKLTYHKSESKDDGVHHHYKDAAGARHTFVEDHEKETPATTSGDAVPHGGFSKELMSHPRIDNEASTAGGYFGHENRNDKGDKALEAELTAQGLDHADISKLLISSLGRHLGDDFYNQKDDEGRSEAVSRAIKAAKKNKVFSNWPEDGHEAHDAKIKTAAAEKRQQDDEDRYNKYHKPETTPEQTYAESGKEEGAQQKKNRQLTEGVQQWIGEDSTHDDIHYLIIGLDESLQPHSTTEKEVKAAVQSARKAKTQSQQSEIVHQEVDRIKKKLDPGFTPNGMKGEQVKDILWGLIMHELTSGK